MLFPFRSRIISPKQYVINRLGDKYSEFFVWAFGDFDENELVYNFPERWNQRHGDKLIISASGPVFNDLDAMMDVWEAENV